MSADPARTLRTARLILRPPAMADADAITEGLGDWEVTRMLARPPWPYRPEHAVQWLEQVTGEGRTDSKHVFMLALSERPDRAIGTAGLERIEPGAEFQLGFWLARPYWGRGLMTEAAGEILRFGFEDLGLARIVSGCLSDNAASARVHEKLGFRALGRSMVPCAPRGCAVEHFDLALDRAAWAARAQA